MKTVLTRMISGLVAVLALMFSQGVLAQAINPTPQQLAMFNQLPDSQKQALIQKYGGELKSSNSQSGTGNQPATNNQAPSDNGQISVQPAAPSAPEIPSAIETSMRARLASDLKTSAKEKTGNQNDVINQSGQSGQSSLKSSDLVAPQKEEERNMAASRGKDIELRSSWERFLQDPKVRGVDNDFSQFGYQLFTGSTGTLVPATDIPVPPEYVLGPGDELQMQLYGSRNDTLSLVVDRNGVIEIPNVGSLSVAGLSFVQARALIAEQLHKKSIGVTASITMGKLRSIRVFVLGDANHPGSYLVSGLSTISYALLTAGGVSKNGSMRHIQLKRNDKTVQELDLYDFLLKGNSRADVRLMPGDVIFIPPIGPVIGVAGQANRPAIYELRDEKNVQEVMQIAGGVLADADVAHMQIDRLNKDGDRNILDLGMQDTVAVQNGDILIMYAIPGMRADTVSLLGHVKRPGKYGWQKDMKLSSLIGSTDDLLPGAFLDYALIERTDPLTRDVSTLRVALDKLLVQKDQQADVLLKPDDNVYVFAKSAIDPLNVVAISGQVVNPGQYPYTDSMRLTDLLFAAGGPDEASYLKVAELTRYEVIDGQRRQGSHFEVNLADAIAGDPNANILLKPHDELFIRTISNWRVTAQIDLEGEIKYPGKYSIDEGERLSSVLQRAGGYLNGAYLNAAIFTRESVRQDQQKQIIDLARRADVEISRMEDSASLLKDQMLRDRMLGKIDSAKRIADQLKSVQATGRIVIELSDIQKLKGTPFDIALRDGDKLIVPKRPDEIMVLGEVYNQTAFVYRDGMKRDDYLAMAGGPDRSADTEHIYVVRANGMVDAGKKGWFGSDSTASIEPGDTIIVPQEVAQFNMLDSALDWSRVVMQFGVSLAAMKTIGVFQ